MRNLLPSDNIYLKAALQVNGEYEHLGWGVRVAGVRMLAPDALEVGLVVPARHAGDFPAALERLPGPAPVLRHLVSRLSFAKKQVHALYFGSYQWDEVAAAPDWRYWD